MDACPIRKGRRADRVVIVRTDTVRRMGSAEARQAAEGVKVELMLTAEDIELARKYGRHTIDVTLNLHYEADHERAANKDVVQVILSIDS